MHLFKESLNGMCDTLFSWWYWDGDDDDDDDDDNTQLVSKHCRHTCDVLVSSLWIAYSF